MIGGIDGKYLHKSTLCCCQLIQTPGYLANSVVEAWLFRVQTYRILKFTQCRFKLIRILETLRQAQVCFKVVGVQAQRLCKRRNGLSRLSFEVKVDVAHQFMRLRVSIIELQGTVVC